MSIHELSTLSGDRLGDHALAIEMGAVPGVSRLTKFGTNEAVGTSFEYVWEAGNGWTKLAAATLLAIASDSADDVMATGTGTWNIIIDGLDANYEAITEIVALNGLTPVLTTQEFFYVNRMFILLSGSDEVNQGVISATDDLATWASGVPQEHNYIQATISATHGQSQQAIYTVPLGSTAFVMGGYIITDSNQNTEFHVMTYDRLTNSRRIALEGTINNGEFQRQNNPYIGVEAKTTVWIEARSATAPAAVSAGLDMVLVDNKYLR